MLITIKEVIGLTLISFSLGMLCGLVVGVVSVLKAKDIKKNN